MKESHRGPLRNACLMVGGKSNLVSKIALTSLTVKKPKECDVHRDSMRNVRLTKWEMLCICEYAYESSMHIHNNMYHFWAHTAQLSHRGVPFAVK